MALDLAFYKTPAGNEPVRDWLKALSKTARQVIGSDLRRVQEHGPVIGMPTVRSLGKGLWEVRSAFNKVEYRTLFCVHGDTLYLLHGFVKKTKATTKGDLDMGYKHMDEVKANEKRSRLN